MATTRIKDLTNTATTVASDEYLAVDGTTNGTSKITRDNFRQDTADAFVAAPGTYNLAPLSGGAVPIDKGGTAATTASAARTSLDVPSNSEAVLVANNLSDVTAATARTNLSVNSIDEDAEATGTKLVGPALYLRGAGPNDFVEVADDAKLSFTDGTDDLPFSISVWVKASDWSSTGLVTKRNAAREWTLATTGSDKLEFAISDTTNTPYVSVDTALTGYEDEWIHVCVTYGGAGPNSDSAFTAAADEMTAYINGSVVASTATNNASYTGMADGADAVWIGRNTSNYLKGHISSVRIFNRELSATEVAQLARGTDLGFADQWGGATATSGTLTVGKRYRLRDWITGDDFTNVGASSNADGVEFIATGTTPTTWTNSSVVENIGTLADFRAENFDSDTGKLYDLSDNAFVGTNNGATLTGRAFPVYETGTWTPSLYFSGTSAATYSAQSGYYTRIGNTVYVRGSISVSGVGASSGAVSVTGLPFTPSSDGASSSIAGCYMTSAANLTSQPIGLVGDGVSEIGLYDAGATGNSALDETNITASSVIKVSATYQIQ